MHLACQRGDLSSVKALTLPINVMEIEDAYRHTGDTIHAYPCRQLPADLDQRNYNGKSSFNTKLIK